MKAAIANKDADEKMEDKVEDEAEQEDTNGGAGGLDQHRSVVDRLLTYLLVEATKTEEDGANGLEEKGQAEEKTNAFDKIQADENDEGKTGAKVRMHDLDLYRYELLTRLEADRDA